MANGDPGYGSYLFNASESERERRTANQRFQRNIDLQKYNIDKQYDIQDRRTTMDEWKFGQEQEDILGTEHITGTAVKNIEEKNIKKKKRDDIVDERTKRRYSFMDMFSPDKDVIPLSNVFFVVLSTSDIFLKDNCPAPNRATRLVSCISILVLLIIRSPSIVNKIPLPINSIFPWDTVSKVPFIKPPGPYITAVLLPLVPGEAEVK